MLAAGSGTDALGHPEGLHQLGGRSMIAHVLRRRQVARSIVVVLGNQRDQVAPRVAALARPPPSRPIEGAVRQEQLGTGDAVLCGLAVLPADFDGVVARHPGDTRCSTPTPWPG